MRQGFTGYEKDSETGLNFAKARYQSANIGRFTSPDPYGPWAMSEGEKVAFLSSPQEWNRYAYVMNNPIRLKDPTGLEVYDTDVSEEHQERIHSALVRISRNGNSEQRSIAKFILKNDVLIRVMPDGAFDGSTNVTDSAAANADIAKGWVSMERAASHITISINSFQLANMPDRAASLEGVLVHEGRHAFGIARTISSLSARQGADKVYNPTEYTNELEAHMSQANYLLRQGGVHREVGLGNSVAYDKFLMKDGDAIKVNAQRIKELVTRGYNVSEQNQGPTTTEKQNLGLPNQ